MSWSNLTTLWHGASEMLLLGEKDELKFTGMTAYIFDPVLKCDSLAFDIDLGKHLWLTKGRFTGLQRDYLDAAALREFISKSAQTSAKRPQIAQMQCRMKGQRHVSYKWGNCILGFTFRRSPEHVLTMFSRTSMITRIGGLDLALAHLIGQGIAEASDEDPLEYKFVWHLSSLQHSALQGVPFFYAFGWDKEILEYSDEEILEVPALRAMKRQLEYFDSLDERGIVSKLGTRRRVREQRRAFMEDRLEIKPVPLAELAIDKLKEAKV